MANSIVVAPMAGGPSTPALVAAAAEAGTLAFLAAGYRTPQEVEDELAAVRAATNRPFGINLFVPSSDDADPAEVAAYAATLRAEGHEIGEARWSDDYWEAKLELVRRERPAVVSFTFGCPAGDVIAELQARGSAVWCTVTSVAEAHTACAAGADVLVLQGAEAGGHQGSYDDTDNPPLPALELLGAVHAAVAGPKLVATGGIADAAAVDEALAAGADAVQCGTAFLLASEAGTSQAQRTALQRDGETALTRAFTGRRGRGVVNDFMRAHPEAPHAYPQLHYVTAPMRAAARAAGDAELINLWAGTSFRLARAEPAAEIIARLAASG